MSEKEGTKANNDKKEAHGSTEQKSRDRKEAVQKILKQNIAPQPLPAESKFLKFVISFEFDLIDKILKHV